MSEVGNFCQVAASHVVMSHRMSACAPRSVHLPRAARRTSATPSEMCPVCAFTLRPAAPPPSPSAAMRQPPPQSGLRQWLRQPLSPSRRSSFPRQCTPSRRLRHNRSRLTAPASTWAPRGGGSVALRRVVHRRAAPRTSTTRSGCGGPFVLHPFRLLLTLPGCRSLPGRPERQAPCSSRW